MGEPHSGVLLAIWPDGKIVRAIMRDQWGKAYVAGVLPANQLAEVAQIINQSKILGSKRVTSLIVDAASEELGVRIGSKAEMWYQNPGALGTNNSDSADPRISALVEQLMAMPTADLHLEPADRWKTYPEEWLH